MDYLIRKYVIVTNDHSHDRETIGYLMTALNLEKSGDCMGADMLFEKGEPLVIGRKGSGREGTWRS